MISNTNVQGATLRVLPPSDIIGILGSHDYMPPAPDKGVPSGAR